MRQAICAIFVWRWVRPESASTTTDRPVAGAARSGRVRRRECAVACARGRQRSRFAAETTSASARRRLRRPMWRRAPGRYARRCADGCSSPHRRGHLRRSMTRPERSLTESSVCDARKTDRCSGQNRKKRTADAALDTVEGACGIFRDESGSWLSHASIMGIEPESHGRKTTSKAVEIF